MNENATVTTPTAPVTFTLDNGQEGSRSAYIRQEFKKDRSRGEIAKELGVGYSIVYTATANMYNAKHLEGGGGTGGTRGAMIEIEDEETGETKFISQAEYFRQQVAAGVKRSDLAKEFGKAYATVYAATKEIKTEGATSGRIMVEVDGVEMGRAEYIRKRYAELTEAGVEGARRIIANELKCDYAVVWAATKTPKAEPDAGDVVNAATIDIPAEATAEAEAGNLDADPTIGLPEVE